MKTFIYAIILTLTNYVTVLGQQEHVKKGQITLTSRVTVRVLDKETFEPIDAKILIVGKQSGDPLTPIYEEQLYKYKIPGNDTTFLSIYAHGYETLNEPLYGNEINGTEVFYLKPQRNQVREDTLAQNFSALSRPILNEDFISILYFTQSNTTMSSRSRQELESVVEFLKKNDRLGIELAGHTDDLGEPDKNMLLASDRANAIREHLIANNISPVRIRSRSFGSTRPVAPNDCEANRRFNRRVVLRMTPTL